MQNPPPPPPPPAPAPPAATISMETERDRLVVAGGTLRVAGRVSPAVKGERVVVRVRRGARKIAAKSVRVDARGAYRLRIRAGRRSGRVTVRSARCTG